MNIIKEYLADVNGVDFFAIISMLIFIFVFILMVIHTFSIRKNEIREFKNIPLEEDEHEPENENENNNK